MKGCEESDKAIKDRDEEALINLTHIEWQVLDEGEAILKLHFAENDYFKNKVLEKHFPSLTGVVIDWCEGKNLTRKAAVGGGGKKKDKGKKDESGKATASFFQLFNTPDEDSKYEEQHQQMILEIAGTIQDQGQDGGAFELFLGAYGSATEFLEAVDMEPENFEECYQDAVVRDRIQRLATIYSQVESAVTNMEKEEDDEKMKLEKNCANLYTERAKIVDGAGDPSKRPPRFWLQVLLNSDTTTHFAGEKDDKFLKYVKDITAETGSDGNTTTTMSLWENPYMDTMELKRTITSEGRLEGTTIEWKDDENGDSMQYKIAKKGKYGKSAHSLVWCFDDEKGPLKENEIMIFQNALVESVVPQALYLYIKTPDALEFAGEDDDDSDGWEESDEDDEDDEEDDDGDDSDDEGERVREVMKGKAGSKKKRREESGPPGLFGTNFTLLHFFMVMILTSQIVSFLM